MELEQEKREQEEEIRVFKAKAKKHRGEEKTGLPRLNNYCRIIGLCGFCNKVAEYRCERCGMVCCSRECYEGNWETHEKACKSPEKALEKPGIYYIDGKPCLTSPLLEVAELGKKAGTFKAKIDGSCIVCERKGKLSCVTCTEMYCSVECHERDWDLHKGVCQPLLPVPEILLRASRKNRLSAERVGEGKVKSRDNVPAF